MCLCLPLAAQMHRYSLGFTVTFNAQNSKLNAQLYKGWRDAVNQLISKH
jgi:hypothetical protein